MTLRGGLVRPRYYHLSYSFEPADAMEPTKNPSYSHGEKTAAEKLYMLRSEMGGKHQNSNFEMAVYPPRTRSPASKPL